MFLLKKNLEALVPLFYLLEFSHLQNKIIVGFTLSDCWKHYRIRSVGLLEEGLTHGKCLVNASHEVTVLVGRKNILLQLNKYKFSETSYNATSYLLLQLTIFLIYHFILLYRVT